MVESTLLIPRNSELGNFIKKALGQDKTIHGLTTDECQKSRGIREIWLFWGNKDNYELIIDHIFPEKQGDSVAQAIMILYKSFEREGYG